MLQWIWLLSDIFHPLGISKTTFRKRGISCSCKPETLRSSGVTSCNALAASINNKCSGSFSCQNCIARFSGFLHEVDEICALLWYYSAYSGNFLPPFRNNLSVSSSTAKISWLLKMGPIGCPETAVKNYHYTLSNIPEERRSQNYVSWTEWKSVCVCCIWGNIVTDAGNIHLPKSFVSKKPP